MCFFPFRRGVAAPLKRVFVPCFPVRPYAFADGAPNRCFSGERAKTWCEGAARSPKRWTHRTCMVFNCPPTGGERSERICGTVAFVAELRRLQLLGRALAGNVLFFQKSINSRLPFLLNASRISPISVILRRLTSAITREILTFWSGELLVRRSVSRV